MKKLFFNLIWCTFLLLLSFNAKSQVKSPMLVQAMMIESVKIHTKNTEKNELMYEITIEMEENIIILYSKDIDNVILLLKYFNSYCLRKEMKLSIKVY